MRGKTKDKIKITERQAQALELRKNGESYRAIASACKVSVYTAFNDVQAALKAAAQYNEQVLGGQALTLELERLDTMLLAITPQIRQGHLGAIDRALRIAERRAKLLGLDAPTRSNVSIDVSSMTDDELMVIVEGE